MNLIQAMEYLSENCPTVFEPICNEMTGLRKENDATKKDLEETQKALNELIFNTLNGGM